MPTIVQLGKTKDKVEAPYTIEYDASKVIAVNGSVVDFPRGTSLTITDDSHIISITDKLVACEGESKRDWQPVVDAFFEGHEYDEDEDEFFDIDEICDVDYPPFRKMDD